MAMPKAPAFMRPLPRDPLGVRVGVPLNASVPG
jgi:hypothetical protein